MAVARASERLKHVDRRLHIEFVLTRDPHLRSREDGILNRHESVMFGQVERGSPERRSSLAESIVVRR